MKVKEISFKGGQFGCHTVVCGQAIVGSFSWNGTPKEKPWHLRLKLVGIKEGPYHFANEHAAREFVQKAVVASVQTLIEHEIV